MAQRDDLRMVFDDIRGLATSLSVLLERGAHVAADLNAQLHAACAALESSPLEAVASAAPPPMLSTGAISSPDIMPALATRAVARVMGDASLATMTEKLNTAYEMMSQALNEHDEPVVLSDIHSAVDQALTDYHQGA